ncbi:DUF2292 domain-containing protein [Pseudomonas sp. NPDC078700]|uniref:DUF2292 domain-containing protein n=1 Tax=Pseudomonas sp. NPDC078700 TaxID=3364424 RepID=UPI0037C5DDAD
MTVTNTTHGAVDEVSVLREIKNALSGLQYGSLEIAVHNGQVVQIERKEKFRLLTAKQNPR